MPTTPPRTTTPTGWARSYQNTPQKAARTAAWARQQAQRFRQENNPVDADYYEEVAEALDAVLAKGVRCRRCGRALTHPDSVTSGIGPECAGKTL